MVERTLATRTIFTGRALRLDVLDVELPDGRRSTREIVRHCGAVVVLGERPDGRIVMVRQYRKAVDEILLEMVAGGLEPGEAPEAAARREMAEESGYVCDELTPLGVIVACPGYSEERQHLFHARVGLAPGAPRPDFDENLAPVALTPDEVEAAITSGELKDSKSLAIWLLWRRTRA